MQERVDQNRLWDRLKTRYALLAATTVIGALFLGCVWAAVWISQELPDVVNMSRVSVVGVIGFICIILSLYLMKSISYYNKQIKKHME